MHGRSGNGPVLLQNNLAYIAVRISAARPPLLPSSSMQASKKTAQGDKDLRNLRELEDSLAMRDREMLALFRLSEIFHSSRPLADLYNDIIGEIGSATGFPISSIATFDHRQKKMIFHGPRGLPDPSGRPVLEVPLEESYLGAVLRTGKPIIVTKTSGKTKYRSELLRKVGARTFVAFPMTVGGRIVGAHAVSGAVQ